MQCTLWTERSAHERIASCATNAQHAARRTARIQKQQHMRNQMYNKNTEACRQHPDARNETNAIKLFGLPFLCGNADEKWNQLSRRGIRQLAEACHGRSLATASRPRPIKLQHSKLLDGGVEQHTNAIVFSDRKLSSKNAVRPVPKSTPAAREARKGGKKQRKAQPRAQPCAQRRPEQQ